eukprot:7695332-Pyramimonas_sp.AAC.1
MSCGAARWALRVRQIKVYIPPLSAARTSCTRHASASLGPWSAGTSAWSARPASSPGERRGRRPRHLAVEGGHGCEGSRSMHALRALTAVGWSHEEARRRAPPSPERSK